MHILRSEGYIGEGIDLRARTSWKHYPPDTQAHLHVHALNPLDLPLSPSDSLPSFSDSFLKQGVFIIANHADELSPWTPVIATLCSASGFLSIPCCTWSFDARFERSQLPLRGSATSHGEAAFSFAPPADTDVDDFVESLRLGGMGGDASKSAYTAYRVWLACLGMRCGWVPENETLRIPSTRNWALVGTFALYILVCKMTYLLCNQLQQGENVAAKMRMLLRMQLRSPSRSVRGDSLKREGQKERQEIISCYAQKSS